MGTALRIPAPAGFPGGVRRPGTDFSPSSGFRGGGEIPLGANDDYPFLHEDRLARRFGRRAVADATERLAAREALRFGGRLATRAIPWIGEALLAYDVYQWVREIVTRTVTDGHPFDPDLAGWVKTQGPYEGFGWVFDGTGDNWFADPSGTFGAWPEGTAFPITTDIGASPAGAGDATVLRRVSLGVYPWPGHWWNPSGEWARDPESVDPTQRASTSVEHVPQTSIVPRGQEVSAPAWRDLPFWEPNPNFSPHERTDKGPKPEAEAEPDLPVGYTPSAEYQPGKPPVVRPDAPPTPREPPGPGEKERKVQVKVGGAAAKIINFATESLDLINALYDALPYEFRPGYYKLHGKGGKVFYKKRWNASQWQRMKALYEHWDKVNVPDALKNVLWNDLMDRAFGKWGQLSRKARQKLGDRYPGQGFQLGPWDNVMSDLHIPSG